jgi:rhamnose utilization protein RhaD (predicted bifunctional aldolase and dehydrogenase)
MNDIALEQQFVALSRFAGGRFDLVQSAGGNASVKLGDGRMLIKASGCLMSEVEAGKGYVAVQADAIRNITDAPDGWKRADRRARDAEVADLVNRATESTGLRASIEVFLHAELDRFVLHTHAVAVTAIAAGNTWKEDFHRIEPDALCIPYFTPGIELGVALAGDVRAYRASRGRNPLVIFLENHGLIVAGDSADGVRSGTESVVARCAAHLGVDHERYTNATAVAEYVGGNSVAYLSEDRVLLDALAGNAAAIAQRPFLPDAFVFCGVAPLVVENLADGSALRAHREAHHDAPKVVIYNRSLYFIGATMRKAREVEEVFKSHILARIAMKGPARVLPPDELAYLGDWEAEKYRQGR